MIRKYRTALAVFTMAAALPLAALAFSGSRTNAGCACCGSGCSCVACLCDEQGCACDAGGECLCSDGCEATCCDH